MPRLHRTRQFSWLTTKPPFATPSGKFLRQTGNSVLEAGSPQDALCLAQFHQGEIPILLMDIFMPGVRGTDLAAKVRALRPNIEVICMSGYAEGISEIQLQEDAQYHQKPFRFATLLNLLRRTLTKH